MPLCEYVNEEHSRYKSTVRGRINIFYCYDYCSEKEFRSGGWNRVTFRARELGMNS